MSAGATKTNNGIVRPFLIARFSGTRSSPHRKPEGIPGTVHGGSRTGATLIAIAMLTTLNSMIYLAACG